MALAGRPITIMPAEAPPSTVFRIARSTSNLTGHVLRWMAKTCLLVIAVVAFARCTAFLEGSSLTQEEALYQAHERYGDADYSDLGKPYPCLGSCSGQDAGVQWAKESKIVYPDDCGGRSSSFYEGCVTYADAVQEAAAQIKLGY